VRGDDAVVQNVVDVGLGGEAAHSGSVIVVRLDRSDAEVLVAPGKVSAGRRDAGFRVAGDGSVAIEDKVTVGSDAGRVNLCLGKRREEEY
jgi:hypothetical protein